MRVWTLLGGLWAFSALGLLGRTALGGEIQAETTSHSQKRARPAEAEGPLPDAQGEGWMGGNHTA